MCTPTGMSGSVKGLLGRPTGMSGSVKGLLGRPTGMSGSVKGLLGSRAQLGHWISNLTNNKTSKTHTRFDIQCPNSTLENSYDYIFIRGALIFLPACFSARIVLEDAGGCGSATIPLLASRTMIAPFAGCSILNNGREVAGLDLERYL
jgi:hypothetical protein